jgi:hypothetical protein
MRNSMRLRGKLHNYGAFAKGDNESQILNRLIVPADDRVASRCAFESMSRYEVTIGPLEAGLGQCIWFRVASCT